MMIMPRFLAALISFLLLFACPSKAQNSSRLETLLGIPAKNKPAPPLPPLEGFQDYVRDGKLVLSLDDAIRLALLNNTDIRLDQSAIDTAKNNALRSFQPFDPLLNAFFNDQRSVTPGFQELQGASVLNNLSQTTQLQYNEKFETGTSFQTTFFVNKNSTNSSFFFLNPYYFSTWQFQVTQPLMRNFGVFYNRAPIVIAQRNVLQARAVFEGEVSDTLLQAIIGYWNVVLGRENLVVQKKSFDEAQQSYDRDKKALSLGALPPLDIYRPESQVAARRVSVIQAEYDVTQVEDRFRQLIGADRDPAIRVLDLDLTEDAKPSGALLTIDIPTALSHALATRPEFERDRQQLSVDDLKVRFAHNQLRPDLELAGAYTTTGVAGNQLSFTTPPVPISYAGVGDSLSQVFHFNNPTYGFTLTLNLPIRNRSGQADLADALVGRQHDQYQQVKTTQGVTLDIANAVHQLDQAKLALEAATVSVDLAQKNLRAEERKHELGSETAFFVLDAQTQLAQAEFSLAQAQTNYQVALASLDHATGELIQHHHIQLQTVSH